MDSRCLCRIWVWCLWFANFTKHPAYQGIVTALTNNTSTDSSYSTDFTDDGDDEDDSDDGSDDHNHGWG